MRHYHRQLEILLSKSDLGAGKRGACLGPDALMISAADPRSPLFQHIPVTATKPNHLFVEHEPSAANHIQTIIERDEALCSLVRQTLSNQRFPLIFTGDHSNATGCISGIREAFPDQRIGVIWIDAHGDIHTPFTSPSGNLHGMPLGALLGLDNEANRVRDLTPEVIQAWQQWQRIGSKQICPKILPSDLVLLDIRDLEEQEWNAIHQLQIKHFTPQDRQQQGIQSIIEAAIAHLHHCDKVFVSFDVDSLDSSISTGTGTPAANGLSVDDAKMLLKAFWELPNLCGLEISEINPLLDFNNSMADTMADILQAILSPSQTIEMNPPVTYKVA